MSDTTTDEAGLARPLAQLRSVLIPGETLEAWAIQMRLFALNHRRLLVAAKFSGARPCGGDGSPRASPCKGWDRQTR